MAGTLPQSAVAQNGSTDSSSVFTLTEFIRMVLDQHPVAKQAGLLKQRAGANLMLARGGFDSELNSQYDRKSFDGKNYYSRFNTELKIPTWFGIEVKTGYDRFYGLYQNPEELIPGNGQSYLGISVPLLQNMITDKKRTALRQAKILQQSAEAEQLLMLNDLLLDAINAYLSWSNSFYQTQLLKDAVEVAKKRFDFVKRTAILGDRPAIDTTEALTQQYTRQAQFLEQLLEYQNATIAMSYYIWDDNGPVFPESFLKPETISIEQADSLLLNFNRKHSETQTDSRIPSIRTYDLKIKLLEAERKLKIEGLKPRLQAVYNVLGAGGGIYSSPQAEMFGRNYKFGLQFSMPISFTAARAEYKMTKIKLADARYQLELKTRETSVKLESYKNEIVSLTEQIGNLNRLLNGYLRLLQGEEIRLTTGESSMFLVNARENKVYDARLKLNELLMKVQKAHAKYDWVLGQLTIN